MVLNEEQTEIIERICDLQEESLIEIYQGKINDIYNSLVEEEYDIDEDELVDRIIKELKIWDELKRDPKKFFELLDDDNIGMVRHHLFNEYYNESRGKLELGARILWRKLNMRDKVNKDAN